jgi:hypothetical protein
MERLQAKREWSAEEADLFYTQLLHEALKSIPDSGVAIVLGAMFINGLPEDNFKKFEAAQNKLREGGIETYNQLPVVDYNLKEAPFKYDRKFELFYKPLIQSGKINACYLLPGWEHSKGVQSEKSYAEEIGIPIYILSENNEVINEGK